MSVELLQTLSIVSYVIAGVLLLTAIALFFLLNIPKLYGDLTGKNAKKAIESIRQQNEGSMTAKTAKGSSKNSSKPSGQNGSVTTEKFSTSKLAGSQETTVLGNSIGETTVLAQETSETTVLSQTFPAQPDFSETVQLDAEYVANAVVQNTEVASSAPAGTFNVVEELGYATSTEIIQ